MIKPRGARAPGQAYYERCALAVASSVVDEASARVCNVGLYYFNPVENCQRQAAQDEPGHFVPGPLLH